MLRMAQSKTHPAVRMLTVSTGAPSEDECELAVSTVSLQGRVSSALGARSGERATSI